MARQEDLARDGSPISKKLSYLKAPLRVKHHPYNEFDLKLVGSNQGRRK